MEVLDKMIDFDFGYQIMSKLFQEGKITFTELCKYVRNETIPKRLTNMETKEINIEIPEGYEIDESKSSFEKIVFKKKEKKLPKTYGEFLNNYDYSDRTAILVQNKYEKAFLALRMLIELRDVYNDEWKPNWNDKSEKHCIFYNNGSVELFIRNSWSCILAFKSRELRNEFYNNFKYLIEQAKELL